MNNSVLSQKFITERKDWPRDKRIVAKAWVIEPKEI